MQNVKCKTPASPFPILHSAFCTLHFAIIALAATVAWLSFDAAVRGDEPAREPEAKVSKPADVDRPEPGPVERPKPSGFAWPKLGGFAWPKQGHIEPSKPAEVDRADPRDAKPSGETPTPQTRKLRFQFRFQPWKDVLDWFAQQADLSLVMDAPPQGTFNYSDTREYTPAEAIDLLNGVLLTKGYTLIRRDRMLMLINLEDGVPANLVPVVPLESLDTKGEFELVSVLFNLQKLKPEDAEAEIRKLMGPQGAVVSLPKSRQVFVTETAGRLRAIRTMLQRVEGPDAAASGVQTFELKYARPDDVLPVLRQLLDIPEDKAIAADGSIRIAAEAGSGRLLVSGRMEKISRVGEILKGLDVPAPGEAGAGPLGWTPQLEVYPIAGADPPSVLSVMQTLMVGQTDVRLALDSKTNSLVVLARPAQQATIHATLAQLQREGQRVDVIHLRRVEPQTAVLAINKLFVTSEPGKGPGGSTVSAGPQVDADPASRQLMIRGTEAQIEQIRGLLVKMGESLASGDGTSQSGRVRTVPMSSAAARSVLDRIQEIWPTMHPNKIRVIGPAPDQQPAVPKLPAAEPPKPPAPEPPKPSPAGGPSASLPGIWEGDSPIFASRKLRQSPTSASLPGGARVIFVAEQKATKPPPAPASAAPIIVMPGPNGLIITSEDPQALDEFENLLNSLAEGSPAGGRETVVYYLKHAKAAAVTPLLDQILGGGTLSDGPPGQPPPPAAANGPDTSGVMGSLARMGISRRMLATGPVKITPDPRLNAIVVQANRVDLDKIQELLKVLDLKESPEEVTVAPKPRRIAVQHTRAQEIADTLKQVYADRIVENPNANRPAFLPPWMARQQTPQSKGDDATKVAIGVDSRTNSLIVSAVDGMFEEVKQLVEELDVAAADQSETVRVVTLHRTSASAVEDALSAIVGDSVQMGHAGSPGGLPGQPPGQPGGRLPRWMRPGGGMQPPGGAPGAGPGGPQQGPRNGRRSRAAQGPTPPQ